MSVYCSKKHVNNSSNSFCTHCGEALPLTVGQVIDNRYEIARILGQGGFGRSYLAIDRQKSRQKCVLKEFAPQVVKSEDLQKAKELFEREASVLKKIQHPQIPRFHASLQAKIGTKDFFFLVQDYIEGANYYQLFAHRQSQGKSFSEEEVINLLYNLLPVLSYIHSLDIVHRDISPDNLILRQSDNLPVLIDFGGVKQLPAYQGFWQTQLAGNGTLLGKKGYAPEEQLIQGKVFKSSDLYSFAVTVLVLVTGKEPQLLYDSYNGTWYWGKEINVSPKLEAILKKMLAYKPSDRYQKADQVLKDLPPSASLHTVNTINTMQPPVNTQNPYITKLKTMVAAPGVKRAQAIGSKFHHRTQLAVQQIPMPVWLRPFAVSFIITTGVTLTGVGVWALGNFMVKSVSSITLPKIEVPKIPSINNPGGVANSNRSIQEVFSRLQELEISPVVFTRIVDERFYTLRTGLQRRVLTDKPEDRVLREQWNSTADELLKNIERANLSQTARRKIGSYSQQDSQRWDQLAKAGRLGKYKSFQDLREETYQKFDPLFPGQERGKLNQQTFLQIWYAIASDQVGNK
ncbi:serine/threonine protein kinase [Anabaena sphaerica FACHB-251]|uniref:non-specific serine/threonine protein kinase n=1 Tax=Anabaena sphaerica FACHB-251 TaxID=2692883 RepID=A0A927A0E3_9NOST|nr:serine/threonine-protein kinase [Anabaena sphaerica]MBD2293303.1 serine/threonine protein kinase [Anabaena sphaerica FACHB-251]